MNWHPYAALFPMQTDEEIRSLADDIVKHGLRQPIVIDADEKILDGRNRAAACAIAQVQPIYEPFVGTDAEKLAFVASVNVHRRHLTTSQRAEIAATIATMKAGENQHTGKKNEGGSNELPSKPVTTKQAAKLMNVSVASVKRAKAKAATKKLVAEPTVQATVTRKAASPPLPPKPEAKSVKRPLPMNDIKIALMRMRSSAKHRAKIIEVAAFAWDAMSLEQKREFFSLAERKRQSLIDRQEWDMSKKKPTTSGDQ